MTSTQNAPDTPTRTGPLAVVRRHPLLTFFLLANLLSWISWAPYVLSQSGLGVLPIHVDEITGMLPGAYLGPIFSAFLVTAIADGRQGLRRWFGRLLRWRVAPRWYAVALLGVPAGMLLTGLAFSGGVVHPPSAMALALYVPMLILQFVTTGLAEEPGWRDFALPRLQDRFHPLAASMILGPIWAVWHLPLFFAPWGEYPEASWTRAAAFLLFCIGFNLVMTWIFNRTGAEPAGGNPRPRQREHLCLGDLGRDVPRHRRRLVDACAGRRRTCGRRGRGARHPRSAGLPQPAPAMTTHPSTGPRGPHRPSGPGTPTTRFW